MKKIFGILLSIVLLLTFTACNKVDTTKGTLDNINYEETEDMTNYVKLVTDKDKVMLIELYPETAPITVDNFKKLVKQKFYDGLIFHRVIADFVIQTGDPTGTGRGGSDETIKGEFKNNGVTNTLSHRKGILSMARNSKNMDSASSQFFICVSDKDTFLDGDYAAFGKVIAGYDVAEEISKVKTDKYDKPLKDEKIKNIRFININH